MGVLDDIKRELTLPHGWCVDFNGSTLSICKIQHISSTSQSSTQPLVISHCLSVEQDCSWTVHGKQVSHNQCTPLESVPSTLDPTAVNSLLSLVNSLQVCPGNPDAKFISMCHARNGHIEASDGTVKAMLDNYCPVMLNGQKHMTTVRTMSCHLLVRGFKCAPCNKCRAVLRALWSKGRN